jgi:REP element-mobilizing transposase RayT
VLGRVVGSSVALSTTGHMVRAAWLDLATRYEFIRLGEFVVMPNHVHGIIWVCAAPGSDHAPQPLTDVICRFKTGTTYLHRGRLWQRSFHDHAIRNERELERIREYVRLNPARWTEDRFHPGGP